MLRFVNLGLPGSLAFVEGEPECSGCDQDVLVEFISLKRRSLVKLSAVEDYAGFASRYGSLDDPDDGVALPAGALAFVEDLPSVEGPLYLEPVSKWSFHVDAMRDIAMLHSFLRHPPARLKATGARILRGNCIVFANERGAKMCLYHGTDGGEGVFRHPTGRLPEDVASYLEAIGAGFCYVAPFSYRSDSLENRREWLAANCAAIMEAYLSSYLAVRPGKDGSMLSRLQSELAALIDRARPVTFCLLCGGGASAAVEEYTMNFDGNACRAVFYRIKEDVKGMLVEKAGYSQAQASELTRTSRGGYRAKQG